MLAATETTVYRIKGRGEKVAPVEVFHGRDIRRIVEGPGMELIADAMNTLHVLREGQDEALPTGIEEPIESLLLLRADPLEGLIGTEGAHLYRFDAKQVKRVRTFDALACRDQWYTPWGGPPAVRSLAASPNGCVWADIHVGSIMRSEDEGRTWEPVDPGVHEDVHQVASCPAAPQRVYANTARAVYVSPDRGRSWEHRGEGLGNRYGRAIAVHPKEPDLLLASVSDGPHGENVHGQLFRSDNAGRAWAHVDREFPEATRENINTYHVAFDADGQAWAIVGERLYIGRERATKWQPFWSAPEPLIGLSAGAI